MAASCACAPNAGQCSVNPLHISVHPQPDRQFQTFQPIKVSPPDMDTHMPLLPPTTASGIDTDDNRIQIRLALHHQNETARTDSRDTARPVTRSVRSVAMMALALVLASQGLTACKRHPETVGEKVDHFGDKVQDTFDPPKGPAEKAGRSIDRTLHND